MAIRWILTTISIFIMAYFVYFLMKKENIHVDEQVSDCNYDNTIKIKGQYCIGCGLCARLYPDYFIMADGKAKLVKEKINLDDIEGCKSIINKCPGNAITL